MGLVHGDYRLDNMLFGAAGADRPLTVVDWQTVTWGPAMTDLAVLPRLRAAGGGRRRKHYDALLDGYHRRSGRTHRSASRMSAKESAGRAFRRDDGHRLVDAGGTHRSVATAMFMTMLQRHCEHVLDTDALATLPAPATIEPLRPSPDDESAHTTTDEPLWNESWYADFVDAANGFGGWVRLGLIPNQQTAWLHALLRARPAHGRVVDFEVPLPTDPWTLQTGAIDFMHSADDPLRTYRIALRATRPVPTLIRPRCCGAEQGAPAEVAIDLEWTTDGTPYQYRLTTRYEIPCTVSGTVTIDGHHYTVDSVPGQRDHSWGVRDWWSMDWVWSALHLDDGTHLHAVDIRIPGVPPVGIGYVQDRGGTVTELQTIAPRATFDADGLPVSATLAVDPGGVTATVDVRGHAPLLLVALDGRTSQFPRVWATVSTADGRTGVGWLEWNRNLPPQ